jgi:hypothetical protein
MVATKEHKKGKCAPGKKNKNWRILAEIDIKLQAEALRLGYGEKGTATFINAHFTRYFNNETIKRDA